MTHREYVRSLIILLSALAVLTLYRGGVILHNQLPLFLDEAQYWYWSLEPGWGYYSKPPMVAWIIHLFNALGQSELVVRLGTLLLHPLTAILLYMLGYRMFDARTALWAALLFISLPLVGFNSLFMTTDAPLFFFWGLAVYALWKSLEDNAWGNWILTGIAAGMGMLSKYSMVFFVPSVVLALLMPAYKRHWSNPRLYAAAMLAMLIFLPNLWWNAQMDFVSFRHTAEISHLNGRLFHPSSLIEFLGGQFACMGPIAFPFLVAALALPATWRDDKLGFLAAMTLPFLALISVQALLARANVNWAAPVYFAGALLVAANWARKGQKPWFLSAIALNLIFLSCFYHYHFLAEATGFKLTRRSDPYARVLGWPQAGRDLRQVLSTYPQAKVAVLGRDEFSLLSYYAQIPPHSIKIWNPGQRRQNHFHIFSDMKDDIGKDFIFVAQQPLDYSIAQSFEGWSAIGTITVPIYTDYYLRLYMYYGTHFKGYR